MKYEICIRVDVSVLSMNSLIFKEWPIFYP